MWFPSWIVLPVIFLLWPFYFIWWQLPAYFIGWVDQYATARTPEENEMARGRLKYGFRDHSKPWPTLAYQTLPQWNWTAIPTYDELYEQTCGMD